MKRQYQIKISVSKKLDEIISEKAKKFGVKKSKYCFNIILEDIRKEK